MKKSDFIQKARTFLQEEFSDKSVQYVNVSVQVSYNVQQKPIYTGTTVGSGGYATAVPVPYSQDHLNYSYNIERDEFEKTVFKNDFKETVEK